eukprot:gene21374-28318_t
MSLPPADEKLISRLLDTISDDVLPLTEAAVKLGNKVFGAALLRKSDLSTYLAETNNEIESPLHHGEMHLLKKYHEIPSSDRIPPKDLLFLSTHEPCTMCLSAITWAGFDNFYYFFSHVDSRDSFVIPHDLKILKEVFNLDAGGYRTQNDYWTSFSIRGMVSSMGDASTKAALEAKVDAIFQRYNAASEVYQSSKADNIIPLN